MKRIDPAQTTRFEVPQLAAAQISRAARIGASTLHEAGGKIGALPAQIRALDPKFRVCGRALTVHSPGGDNLWLHRALAIAQPGDVMVVYASGAYDYGYWGEVMATAAQARGVAGLVMDGCVRDLTALRAMNFPVFARGTCMRGTGKDFGALGWINYPILLGDISVAAGDLIVGDEDGVVAIPSGRVDEVLNLAEQREAKEAQVMERLRRGETTLAIYGWE